MRFPDSGLSPLRLESLGPTCLLFLASVFLNPVLPSSLPTTFVVQDMTVGLQAHTRCSELEQDKYTSNSYFYVYRVSLLLRLNQLTCTAVKFESIQFPLSNVFWNSCLQRSFQQFFHTQAVYVQITHFHQHCSGIIVGFL